MRIVLEFEVERPRNCDQQRAQDACLIRLIERKGCDSLLQILSRAGRRLPEQWLSADGTTVGQLTVVTLR